MWPRATPPRRDAHGAPFRGRWTSVCELHAIRPTPGLDPAGYPIPWPVTKMPPLPSCWLKTTAPSPPPPPASPPPPLPRRPVWPMPPSGSVSALDGTINIGAPASP
eukprot:6904021-Prymnesium_polylepis.1